jgi:hypothetical protein
MNALAPTPTHPWIVSLQSGLDTLETALLHGDAPGVEKASASIQTILQGAPKTAEFAVPGSGLRLDMQTAAHRFGQLRQAVLRASAQSQRAVNSVLPQKAPATYGHMAGAGSSTGGAGRAYLSA